MFSNCKTLSDLNARRRDLVSSGTPVASVNAAYNKAKKELLDARPEFRKVISYTSEAPKPMAYFAYPLKEGGPSNELTIAENFIFI